ncbi:MAG: hypothetical protein Q9208_006799 [Pyrenodesmia sp. 3 TL-2023]
MHFSKIILPFFAALAIAQDNNIDNDPDPDPDNGATSLSIPAAGTTPTITSMLPAGTGDSANDDGNDNNDGNGNDDGDNTDDGDNATPSSPTNTPSPTVNSASPAPNTGAAGALKPGLAMPGAVLAVVVAAGGMM